MAEKQTGFTIVELLVVIVVIGILAAIVIIAYNGVSHNAVVASLEGDLTNSRKALLLDQVNNGGFPATVAAAQNGAGLPVSPNTTYQYIVNNNVTPQTFCLMATNGTTSYFVSQDSQPASGICTITNLITNPGIESDTVGVTGANASTIARDTTKAQSGAASALVTMPAAASGATVGALFFALGSTGVPTILTANTTYTVSAYVYVPSSTVNVYMSVQGGGIATTSNSTATVTTKDTWTRVSNTFTTSASGGNVNIYLLNKVANPTAGAQFWLDNMMLTQGSSAFTYADGSSPGWTWGGTVNDSTSSGPAL